MINQVEMKPPKSRFWREQLKSDKENSSIILDLKSFKVTY